VALQKAWLLLKSMYRNPKNEEELKHNKIIMRNKGGFDARWCANPDCNAMKKYGSNYCVPCALQQEENEDYEEPPMPEMTNADLRDY